MDGDHDLNSETMDKLFAGAAGVIETLQHVNASRLAKHLQALGFVPQGVVAALKARIDLLQEAAIEATHTTSLFRAQKDTSEQRITEALRALGAGDEAALRAQNARMRECLKYLADDGDRLSTVAARAQAQTPSKAAYVMSAHVKERARAGLGDE